jgi:D-serine deaminase-like pyridoxal phosphate-dependent protein
MRGQSGPEPMLPVTLQFIIATIAYAINERMARRVDYLQEVRVLKEALAAATGKTLSICIIESVSPLGLGRHGAQSPSSSASSARVLRSSSAFVFTCMAMAGLALPS